ncbi:MAG: hypothetical protein U5L46_13005 [Agrobacterium sp.]|nr:hypothetical protein [Agrobacterium sp.]
MVVFDLSKIPFKADLLGCGMIEHVPLQATTHAGGGQRRSCHAAAADRMTAMGEACEAMCAGGR